MHAQYTRSLRKTPRTSFAFLPRSRAGTRTAVRRAPHVPSRNLTNLKLRSRLVCTWDALVASSYENAFYLDPLVSSPGRLLAAGVARPDSLANLLAARPSLPLGRNHCQRALRLSQCAPVSTRTTTRTSSGLTFAYQTPNVAPRVSGGMRRVILIHARDSQHPWLDRS